MNDGRPYDESPEHRRRIRDALDACRPAPLEGNTESANNTSEHLRDFDQPELEFLAAHLKANPEDRQRLQRVQKFDRGIRAQMAEVPVPEGLAERLLAGLNQPPNSANVPMAGETFDEAVSQEQPSGVELRPVVHEKSVRGMKWWIGIATAILVAVGLASLLRPTPPLQKEDVYSEALAWAAQPAAMQPVPLEGEKLQKIIKEFPPSSLVSNAGQTKAAPLNNFLGHKGVAYSLTSRGGANATLLVVKVGPKQPIANIPIGKPGPTPFNTAGQSLLVWREDDLLYVLVVPDDPANDKPYKQFLEEDMPIAGLHRSQRVCLAA